MTRAKVARAARWILAAVPLCAAVPVARDLKYLPAIGELAAHEPRETAMMAQRAAESRAAGRQAVRRQIAVPDEAISPLLKAAVVAAEDNGFTRHAGVDWREVARALRDALRQRRLGRGASTITQQLVKNLYLRSDRSLSRKASEMVLALAMERRLTKTRILDLYLNNIEWGEGIYGCGAAAQSYFGRPAAQLTPEQAIRLAAMIINPRRYGPYSEAPLIIARRERIAAQLYLDGRLTLQQFCSLPF